MEAERRAPKSEALRALYWRSEILQLLSWLRGEGLGDLVDPPLLDRLPGVDAAAGRGYLDRLTDDGDLDRDGDWLALSARGPLAGDAGVRRHLQRTDPSRSRRLQRRLLVSRVGRRGRRVRRWASRE
jgi:hypothetical protein